MTSVGTTSVCPACGASASGKFCSECGAALGAERCPACRTDLLAGARFCHRCGLPAGAQPPAAEFGPERSQKPTLPWVVAGIALLAMVALVAGQRFALNRPQSPEPVSDAVDQGPRAPDISALTPAQRAMRLYDRIMTYSEAGKTDSVRFFAPMAVAAYEMLGDLDLDGHYDLGRIGEVSGDLSMASAQADTILRRNPNHLLGLILAAHVAERRDRSAEERRFFQRLIAAEPAERSKKLPEYDTHDRDIAAALEEARRIVRR